MQKWTSLTAAIALLSIVSWGCTRQSSDLSSSAPAEHDHAGHDHAGHDHAGHDHDGHDHSESAETFAVAMYCGDCGFAKGSEQCCQAGAEECACGFAKGAPLCCKLTGDFSGKTLCGKCGEIAGTENCCNADAEKCELCSLNKGAPLCCVQLTQAEGEAQPEGGEAQPEAEDSAEG